MTSGSICFIFWMTMCCLSLVPSMLYDMIFSFFGPAGGWELGRWIQTVPAMHQITANPIKPHSHQRRIESVRRAKGSSIIMICTRKLLTSSAKKKYRPSSEYANSASGSIATAIATLEMMTPKFGKSFEDGSLTGVSVMESHYQVVPTVAELMAVGCLVL